MAGASSFPSVSCDLNETRESRRDRICFGNVPPTVSSKVVYLGQNFYKGFDLMVIRQNLGSSLYKSKSSKDFKP